MTYDHEDRRWFEHKEKQAMQNNTNISVGTGELPETQRLGDFCAVARLVQQTGQVFWELRMNSRALGDLDGLTAYQVMQVLRAMCKVQICAAKDTRGEIREALGI